MIISNKEKFIEVKADDGKLLVFADGILEGGSFPLDFDTNEIREIPAEEAYKYITETDNASE